MSDTKQQNQKDTREYNFKAGNKAASKGPEFKCLRAATKDEVMRCAGSLTKPIRTLQDDIQDPSATRLAFITANAIKNNNTKYIQWLLEMAIGKPKQTVEQESKGVVHINVDKEDLAL